MTFSILNFKKRYASVVKILHSKESWTLLPSGGYFVRVLPTLALREINSDSAGNYQLIEEESTGRISFADCQHSPSMGEILIMPGIIRLGTRNPPEEYDSAGNNQLMEADSDRQDQNVSNNPLSSER
jgi:hypothetical protein